MEKIKSFVNELLLYSGQYALFYIIMNFSKDGVNYFQDSGHTILLFVLVLQTMFLVVFGNRAFLRFLGSLIAPLFYTVIEFKLDFQFIFNTAHIFFWVFSILVGLVQALQIKTIRMKTKKINEYIITFMNTLIFLFVYFYFDLNMGLKDKVSSNQITMSTYNEKLKIFHIFDNLYDFFTDPTHIYIIIGGTLLSLSIAVGRIKILELNEEIKQLFGRYIDNKVRDRILSDGTGKSEKVELCVLFSDIRNFTQISENYNPEEITQMLNIYFSEWADLSDSYSGTIDKYIGDAVMIVFSEKDMKKSTENAVNCGLKMLKKLEEIQIKLIKKGLPKFEDIGIGIHYGPVIAGDIGSKNRVNYTYIGDTVNIASRLESICKDIDSNLTISQIVYDNLHQELRNNFKEIDKEIFLKGKKKAVKVFYFKLEFGK